MLFTQWADNSRRLRYPEQYVHDIRTITFDLDDTLWAIHPVIARAERRLYNWLAKHYPRTTARFTLDAIRALRMKLADQHLDKAHDLTFLRRAVLSYVSDAAGYDDSLVDKAFAVFDEARNDVEVFPEVLPALASLRERHVLIALTNGNANLVKIGIRDFFDDVVSAAGVGAAKPARRIFDVAVRTGGAAAHQTLHVGDDENWYAHANLFINDRAPQAVFAPIAAWLEERNR